MSEKNENATYPYKYGELKVLAQLLAKQVKEDHIRRVKEYGSTPYSEVITYDKAKTLLALLEEQEIR